MTVSNKKMYTLLYVTESLSNKSTNINWTTVKGHDYATVNLFLFFWDGKGTLNFENGGVFIYYFHKQIDLWSILQYINVVSYTHFMLWILHSKIAMSLKLGMKPLKFMLEAFDERWIYTATQWKVHNITYRPYYTLYHKTLESYIVNSIKKNLHHVYSFRLFIYLTLPSSS